MNKELNIIEINSLDKEELKIFSSMSEPQLAHFYEPEPGIFIAESPKVVERALDAGYEPISMLLETSQVCGEAKEIINRTMGIPVYVTEKEVIKGITGFPMTRGVLCAMKRKPDIQVESMLKDAKRIAIFENIENPTNIGAIFRSAAALGLDGIILSPGCADPLYRRAIRVSMGTVFQIPWTYMKEWPGDLNKIKEMGFKIVSLALSENAISLEELRLESGQKAAILLGNEGEGLTEDALNICEETVMIPMYHGVDSLNVGAAAAVAFWQIMR